MFAIFPLFFMTILPAHALEVDFTNSKQIYSAANFDTFSISSDMFAGYCKWDPYFYLTLPKDGLDIKDINWLCARIYSSEEADSLDLYYKDTSGEWGLGGNLPIKKGWATYCFDLRETNWHEGTKKSWGTGNKNIAGIRIDPGNQANRWIVVDYLSLVSEPIGEIGVFPEPLGTLQDVKIVTSETIDAGESVIAQIAGKANWPAGLTEATLLCELGGEAAAQVVQIAKIPVTEPEFNTEISFPTSHWATARELMVRVKILELENPVSSSTKIDFKNPHHASIKPPVVSIKDFRGDPTMFVNDRPTPLFTYSVYGSEPGVLQKEINQSGLNIYTDWPDASLSGNLGQISPGVYDYSTYDAYFTKVLDAVPDAYFLPHISLTAPDWWQKLHPEECCLYSNGQLGPSSFASQLWLDETTEGLRRLIRHLRAAPYADRILGYLFFNGYTAEWQMWATWESYSDDYSEPALKKWRLWLQGKYSSDTALQVAWNMPDINIANAPPPTHEQQRDDTMFLRDPATHQQIIDWHSFTSDMTADAILHFARVVKEECGRTQLAGTYYGYMFAHGMRQALTGHNAISRVLLSPDIDFLMSPPMYTNREPGGTSTFMSATESVKLHGKLWLDESDLRTSLAEPGSGLGQAKTLNESIAITWREFANVLTRRSGVSWYDMGGGWYSDPSMRQMYRQQLTIANEALYNREKFKGDVAVIVDDRSYNYYGFTHATWHLTNNVLASMPHTGLAWDTYLLSDITNPSMPDYKLYILLNTCRMDESERVALYDKARKNGATLLFQYAPGVVTENGLDATGITRTTGIKTEFGDATAPATWTFSSDAELAPISLTTEPSGFLEPLNPRPIITDPKARVISRWTCDNAVATAGKTVDGVPVVYFATIPMPVNFIRNVARQEGAHVYVDTGDSIYTDGIYLVMHTTTAGEKTLQLPEPHNWIDCITGQVLVRDSKTYNLYMNSGQTLFMQLQR